MRVTGATFPVSTVMNLVLRGIFLVFISFQAVYSQATFTTTGSWDVASNWSGSNIGDLITEDVTVNNNRAALINNGFNYTIGNLTFSNQGGLTINSTGSLNVGQSGTPKSLTAGNDAFLTVIGTLIIWGDLIVVNNLSLDVTGTLIVKGDLVMNNGAAISVTGSVDVEGDLVGGNNTSIALSGGGSMNVDGSVSTGNGSTLTGPDGSFSAGSCAPVGSAFCNSGALPVDLLYFNALATTHQVRLFWSTASELNSDFFEVQKSIDGLAFESMAKVSAQGNSTIQTDYEVYDEKPTIGRSYYRLKQVDVDGTAVTYKIVLVEFTGAMSSSVYPNPVRTGGDVTLELNFVPTQPVEVLIYDLSGRQIERFYLSQRSGVLPIHLSAGLYMVRFNSVEFKNMIKLQVCE